jgi:signal transduction histidine kinase
MKNPDVGDAVDHMNADVRRLAAIADRYGQMGREPRLKPVSVMETILETVEYFKLRKGLLGQGVILEIRGDCNDAMIMGNRVLLGWVLENLIKNAAAACAGRPDGGHIILECASRVNDPRNIEILVSDDGSGIPYSDQGRIFNAGFTTRKGGWGLGLSLARRIIEEYHHGSIRLVSSLPGRGTVFSIVLSAMNGGEVDNDTLG